MSNPQPVKSAPTNIPFNSFDQPNTLSNFIQPSISSISNLKTQSNICKSKLKPADSLESIILEKVIKRPNNQLNKQSNKQSSKASVTTILSEDTIVISDDEDILSPGRLDQLENESVIIIDDDSQASNKTKIATRSSSRQRNQNNKSNKASNDENRSLEQTVNNAQNINDNNNNHEKVNQLNRPNKGHVVIYTDGACSNNGRSGAKAGLGVWWGHDDPRNVSEPLAGRATNNRAEILAAVRGINQAADQNYDSVTVCSDRYLKNQNILKLLFLIYISF